MDARIAVCLICSALLFDDAGRSPIGSPPQGSGHVSFAAAWLIDQLDRDADRAREAFDDAAQHEASSDLRALALARRAEIDIVRGADTQARAALDTLRPMLARLPISGSLDLPRSELHDALAMQDGPQREAALARARELFRERFDSLDRDRSGGSVRGIVNWIARVLERGREQRETPRPNSGGTSAAWRTYVLRLLTEERFDAAERLCARLRPGNPVRTATTDIDALRRNSALTPGESGALEALEQAIDTWRQRGDETIVARALAALPY